MNEMQRQVLEFMLKAGQDCPAYPTVASREVRALRLDLIQEEFKELAQATDEEDVVEIYDAILDLLVVTIGTAIAYGLNIEPGWQEVHRSNMSKFIDGHRREDGKWIKGPSYSPAQLKPIIEQLSQ